MKNVFRRIDTIERLLLKQFVPLEMSLLRVLMQRLEPAARDTLRCQIQIINRVRRYRRVSRDVNLYRIRQGKIDWRDVPLFPNREEECKFATIEYTHKYKEQEKKHLHSWLVTGHLSVLTHSEIPSWAEMADDAPVIDKVTFHVDPMVPADPPLRKAVQLAEPLQPLEGVLMKLHMRATITAYFAPLPPAERNQRLSQFDTVFPVDYLEVLSQTDGLMMDGATIHGAYDVHQVNLNEGDFFVIGDIRAPAEDDGALCVGVGKTPSGLYFFTYSDDPPAYLGHSLYEALEKLCLVKDKG